MRALFNLYRRPSIFHIFQSSLNSAFQYPEAFIPARNSCFLPPSPPPYSSIGANQKTGSPPARKVPNRGLLFLPLFLVSYLFVRSNAIFYLKCVCIVPRKEAVPLVVTTATFHKFLPPSFHHGLFKTSSVQLCQK